MDRPTILPSPLTFPSDPIFASRYIILHVMSVTTYKLKVLFPSALLPPFPYSIVPVDYPLWLALIRNKFLTMNALDI